MEEEDWIDIPFPRKPIGTFKGPIRIASRPVKETQGKFTINIDPLPEILNRPNIANLPVTIFSVNGPIRCGKSFFLNQAIKYLKFGYSHPRNWIDQELETGFKWRSQLDSVTEGIEIWPEPFILTDEKNPEKKLALILMDNQGLEDATTDNSSTNKLFCLSNLLSSVFVYGDTKYRSKNFLENLHGFAQFSHSMERDSRGHDSTEPTLQFGTLILQCKDFQFYREFPCNGCEFYDKTSSQTMFPEKCLYTKFFCASDKVTEKANRTKSAMTQMYNEILVCTMRGPGNSEPNHNEFYTSDSWDPQHLLGIRKFIKQVFTYGFLSKRIKQVFGNSLTAQQFSPFVENWAHSVVNNDYNIRIQTALEYSRNAFYGGIISNSMAEYKLKLAEFKRNPSEGIISFHTKAISTIERELWTNVLYFEWRHHFLDICHDKVRKLLRIQKVELERICKKQLNLTVRCGPRLEL